MINVLPMTATPIPCEGGCETPIFLNLTRKGYTPFTSATYDPILVTLALEQFVSFTNESVWAYGFSDTQGFLDNEVLLEYQNYQTSGGLYKTQVIKDNGGFKNNIKLTFSYEFLLRLTHNGVKIMSIPRIGYRHVNLREDSLFWSYKNDEKNKLDEKEVKFWLDTAKKEFFFKNKREVNYLES